MKLPAKLPTLRLGPHRGVLALVFIAGTAVAAHAEQKRLGFVVGMSEYGDTKHPTALQDAGLVAQTLKGAGFEVQEAANLGQDEFRAAFRDFTQKAAGAGPDTIIALYVSGVSLQDDGENILIPAGANIRQKTDLALEGLRLNDFIRALGATPAKARIVMFDTAYTHPYGQLVAEGARGLALTETLPGMVISFNQSPGLTSALPQSNYGPYAMALAEVLREPGLNLNAMFERLRLRVHDLSAGAQTPWAALNVPADVVLTAPASGAPLITSAIPEPEKPLGQVSVEDAYARALAQDTLRGYQDFLTAYPQAPQAKRVRALLAARREALFWQQTRRTNTDRAYWTYLKRYPKGAHSAEAEGRLTRLSAPIAPPPTFDEMIYTDVPPPPPEELAIYDDVVVDDGWGALAPPVAYPEYILPPPPVAIIDLEPPPPPSPWMRALPAVGLGVGAAILANRMWRRPNAVRPVVAPPVPRPPRPAGGWGGHRPVVLPPAPPPPPGVIGGPRPGTVPPTGPLVGRPGGPLPGSITPPPGGPGVPPNPQTRVPMTGPGAGPGAIGPGVPPRTGPGAIGPGTPPRTGPGALPVPPPGAIGGKPGFTPPGAPPAGPQGGPANPPGVNPLDGKPGLRPGGLPPPGARPPVTSPPVAPPAVQKLPEGPKAVAPQPRPGPMIGGRPPMVRPPEVQKQPPMVRPAPIQRPAPPMVRQPPPMVRQAPPPMVRPAPIQRPAPVYRPPAPVARPAPAPAYRPPAPAYRPPPAPAPVYRAPAPVYRPPAPAPRPAAPAGCPPAWRAAGKC